ncbi:hypothetical protein OJ623_RS06865 [Staphylococcus pseudintermedius]|uniref:hypothetical protein n=1 Tax=Staphylococcus pseudintermedius TaxID=283734 RepID=UPI0015F1E494|nr:hypothetical protein [Staphylococcus pseudintermedius]EHT8042644.1 hypothetical protein [Staphylococcus pseudintermedius]EKH7772581.1 hypothetical protein [Staphylococcus pseudintermedius]ELH4387714.1 hypothetical protein [Staphylococcus pseudintermedius]MCE5445895.1 hypothetical protein [Staphylococcus pseudintermedius]QDX56198.1 hypothetical protein DNI27_13365 [Staphylococcus pseudintermedius]
MNKFSNSLPMSTQVLKTFESEENDLRFTKVKIWLMHLGENLNGSFFKKEVVEKAIPTLANTPIMGSISLIEDRKDFLGHETDLVITDEGNIKEINTTVPFGVIPEDNNAQFETRVGDDMIERVYLTVEGILWNKWDDAIEILYGKNGVTSQSMEISEDYKAYFDGRILIFDEFKFYGACLLGSDIIPAMKNSTVELKFSANTKEFINEKMNQFEAVKFSLNEGGNTLSKKDKINFDESEDQDVSLGEDTEELGDGLEEEGQDDLHTDTEEDSDEEKSHDDESSDEEENEEEVKVESDSKPVKEQVIVDKQDVEEAAEVHKEIQKAQEELPKVTDLIKVLGKEYSVEDVANLLKELDEVKEKYSALEQQVHQEKVTSLFNSYSSKLTSDELEELKAKSNKLSITELETEIFATIGKKSLTNDQSASAYSAASATQFNKVGVSSKENKLSKFDAILEELK